MPDPSLKRCDEQDDQLKVFESQVEANAQGVKENQEEISKMKEEIVCLIKENNLLKQLCLQQARYKRRLDLRLIGLPKKEKDENNVRW